MDRARLEIKVARKKRYALEKSAVEICALERSAFQGQEKLVKKAA